MSFARVKTAVTYVVKPLSRILAELPCVGDFE
jgi:hypothetical protein